MIPVRVCKSRFIQHRTGQGPREAGKSHRTRDFLTWADTNALIQIPAQSSPLSVVNFKHHRAPL